MCGQAKQTRLSVMNTKSENMSVRCDHRRVVINFRMIVLEEFTDLTFFVG